MSSVELKVSYVHGIKVYIIIMVLTGMLYWVFDRVGPGSWSEMPTFGDLGRDTMWKENSKFNKNDNSIDGAHY